MTTNAASFARALPLLAALAASLLGCVAGAGTPDGDVGVAEQALCLAEPLKGIDVSSYQGKIDWQAVAGDKIHFAFARVSLGVGYEDPRFAANWKHMKSAGIIRGPYQFFRPDQDAVAQAELMLHAIDAAGGLEDGDLPPAIDVEVTEGVKHAVIVASVHAWLDHVEHAIGRKPIVYTSPGFWGVLGHPSGFAKYPLWVAHWGTDCPTVPSPWKHFTFWQKGPFDVDGIAHPVDGDYFDGSVDDLLSFAGVVKSPAPAAGMPSLSAAEPLGVAMTAPPAPEDGSIDPDPTRPSTTRAAASCATSAGGVGAPAGLAVALAALVALAARRRRA